MDLEVYVQRRGGLDISSATGVFDALERSGSAVDRKGDGLACGGEDSRRHHLTLYISSGASRDRRRARARDSTVYGASSTSAKSFFVHHTQQLAAAAQVGDAKGIRKKITEMKMRLIKDALKATGRGYKALRGPARWLIEYMYTAVVRGSRGCPGALERC